MLNNLLHLGVILEIFTSSWFDMRLNVAHSISQIVELDKLGYTPGYTCIEPFRTKNPQLIGYVSIGLW